MTGIAKQNMEQAINKSGLDVGLVPIETVNDKRKYIPIFSTFVE